MEKSPKKKSPKKKSNPTDFSQFDSVTIRKLKLAQINGISGEYVKILTTPIKGAVSWLGYYLLPLTLETETQFTLSEDLRKFFHHIWEKTELSRADKERQKNLVTAMEADLETLIEFQRYDEELKRLKPLETGASTEYSHKAFFKPLLVLDSKVPNVAVEYQDWLEILDGSVLSPDVPLIYGMIAESANPYEMRGFTFFYNADSLGMVWDQLTDLDIITSAYKVSDLNNPYLEKIRRKIQKNIETSMTNTRKPQLFVYVVADTIRMCTYELAESKLHFEYPEDGTDIVEILRKTFPMLNLGEPINSGFRSTFRMSDIKLNNVAFLDMIRTEALLKKFLFLDESKKSFPNMEKPYFTFHGYEDSDEIKININPIKNLKNTVELIITVEKREQAEYFKDIFSRLMSYYMNNYKDTLNVYKKLLIQLPENFKEQPIRFRKPIKLITQAIKYLPDKRRPNIIENETEELNVSPFPPKGKVNFYYSCEDPVYKFPSTKKINGDIIPFCRKAEELTETEMEQFDVELPEIADETKGKRQILTNDQELDINRLGSLLPELNDLLEPLLKNVLFKGELRRFGNVRGFDSLLGCIALAVDDPEFKKSDNPVPYLRNIRIEVANSTHPWICAQENPDLTFQKIREDLSDPDVDLESKKFIRAVEVFFKVNLFIWWFNEDTREILFEIPNHKFYHARRFDPDWPSILIYRFEPKKRKVGEDPQYQLIVKHNEEKNITVRILGTEITNKLITLYHTAYKVQLWDHGKITTNGFTQELVKGGKITAQILDSVGKCRGLIVDNLCFLIPPVAPYDLPVREPFPNSLKNLGKRTPSAISVIGGPQDQQGIELIGVWYDNVYCPVELGTPLTDKLRDLPQRKPPWVQNIKKQEFETQYRIVRILMTVIRWLNSIDQLQFRDSIIYDPKVKYRIKKMGRRLPTFENFSDATEYLKDKFIGLITDDNIVLPGAYLVDYLDNILIRASDRWREIPEFIPNFYLYKDDFSTSSDIIYLSLETLDLALAKINIPVTQSVIPEIVDYPIIFKEKTQLYLFFPSDDPDLKKLTYNLFVKIRGLKVPYSEIKDKYVKYDVTVERKLAPIDNHTEGSVNFLTLIDNGILVPLL